ncbi:hypothetical protein HRbin17_00492 [bacterium HR17]|uniref:Uncharacterized protein n=1 Tax=Candidatus Fervidibacter japonicus TaxID=2035412 RepID=A0A2H5XA64_9BACT|nr:hypothetical protein HRbin17_00492 [bacterium HR17]
MLRREVPTPVFIGVILVVLLLIAVIWGRRLLGGPKMVTIEQLPPEAKQRFSPFPPVPQKQQGIAPSRR